MGVPLHEHLPVVLARIREAGHLLVLLDYDGTLSPLVDRPEEAALPSHVKDVLNGLVRQAHISLGIVSGRSLADVRDRVGFDQMIYAGNHGMEIQGPGLSFLCPEAAGMADEMRQLAGELLRRLGSLPGVEIEDKRLTLSIHSRRVPEETIPEFRATLARVLGNLSSCFQVTTGNRVHEIRPRAAWNKGRASTWIQQQIAGGECLPVYIGDDQTDEDAFAALHEGITIKVGHTERTFAHFTVSDPMEVYHFLTRLRDVTEG